MDTLSKQSIKKIVDCKFFFAALNKSLFLKQILNFNIIKNKLKQMKNRIVLFVSLCFALIGFQCSTQNTKVQQIKNGVQLESDKLNLKIQFYANNIVRIVKWLPNVTPDSLSLVVIQKTLPDLNIKFQENDKDVILNSDDLKLVISKKEGKIEYLTNDNASVLKEEGKCEINPVELKNEKAYSIRQFFELTPDEGIYGLGQHQYGYMNYRGRTVKLVQTNTDAVTPFLISTKNYGILWDNYSKTIFEDNSKETSLWSDVANNIDYYFIFGNNMDTVIKGYRNLSGQAPMYGKWAYGYWQSKEHYENRAELLSIVKEYRQRRIPIDNIIQDWDYWDGQQNWGQLFFDEKKYPNPKEMIDIIHKNNFHIMISIWASFGPNTPVYKEMQQKGYLYSPVGWAGFKYYDAYNPAANDLYWQYANKGLFSLGMDGWWMDSTEPDIINALTKEAEEYEMKKVENNHLGSFAKYLNPYSLMVTESVYKNQRKETDKKRVYILTRSTFAGQQRAAATTWSGDIGADWGVYRKQIPAGINHCMAGIPYWTFDIGAFVIGAYEGVFSYGGKDPAYQELYTRMFQFGTFCPIFRSHGSETPREIWQFGKFVPTLIKFDNLRYRLIPYIYSLAHKVTANGYTLMRGLPMDFPNDKNVYSIDDQFMFGPSFMACPVTEYMLHRPPEKSVPVAAKYFKTNDGKPGINAKYYKDVDFKKLSLEKIDTAIEIFWYTGRPDYVTDSTLAIRWEGKLVPSQTGKHQFHIKCFGPSKIYLDGKLLPFVYSSVEAYTDFIELQAGKEYNFAVEKTNPLPGAFRVQLYWKTPDLFVKEKIVEKRQQTRKVYLPSNSKWFDFWTGEEVQGGQTITSDAPIDKIPLFVKAGSIVPMGPFVQYAAEKTDPVEVRIYPGADVAFLYYEDENDNYNYEKGMFSTIPFKWDNTKRQLLIGKRQGSFPGMTSKHKFEIVIVSKNKGIGIDITSNPEKVVEYTGEEQVIQF
jgi:alpha-D-xyloside xylohydrolase